MTIKPPTGSKISVQVEGSDMVIIVPHSDNPFVRYALSLFLMVWLAGWPAGMFNLVPQVFSGTARASLTLALVAWIAFGAFAIYCLFRLLYPSLPESLRLRRSGVAYDSGTPPLQFRRYEFNKRHLWANPKRTRIELDRRQLQSLRLRETDTGNRLTVDAGATRLDLAWGASEVEREWLYQVLTQRYSLASPQ